MRHVTCVCEREDWTHVRYLHHVRLLGRWKVSTFALSAAFPPDRACARKKISPRRSVCLPSVSRVTEKTLVEEKLFIIYQPTDNPLSWHTHTQSMSLSLSLRAIGTVTSDLSVSVKVIRSPNQISTHTNTHTHTHRDSMTEYSLWHLLSPSPTLSADPIHYEATRTNYTFPHKDM